MTFDVGEAQGNSYQVFRAGTDELSPYPLQVLLDGEGTVRYFSREFDYAALEAAVEAVLAE